MDLKFDEETGKYIVEEAEVTTLATTATAEMEATASGILSGVTRFEVMGLPLGSVAAGTGIAFVVDRLIGTRLAGWGPLGNLAVAFAVKRFGSKFLGSGVTDAAAFILVYEALADTIQGWLSGVIPGGMSQLGHSAPLALSQGGNMQQLVPAMASIGAYAGAF